MQPKNPLNLGRENNRDGCTRKGDMIILEKADQLIERKWKENGDGSI